MIASLSGTITYKTPELRKDSYVVIDVGGVGYKVSIPANNLQKMEVGQKTILYTYMSVSEYAMDLYGFLEPTDKTFFTLLLDVPGIGPKSALGILDKATMHDVQNAVLEDDYTLLAKTSGLTEKTAEKIVVALKSKVESLTARPKGKLGESSSGNADVLEALVSFGYSLPEAKKALSQIDSAVTDGGQRLKQALKILAKK